MSTDIRLFDFRPLFIPDLEGTIDSNFFADLETGKYGPRYEIHDSQELQIKQSLDCYLVPFWSIWILYGPGMHREW